MEFIKQKYRFQFHLEYILILDMVSQNAFHLQKTISNSLKINYALFPCQ